MHVLPVEILDILNNGDENYVKNVKNASVQIFDIDAIGKRLRELRHKDGRSPNVHVRIVRHKQGRNYTQSVSYSFFKSSSCYLGDISQVKTDGDVIFRKFAIEPDEILDLKNDSDMRKYLIFMTSIMFQNNRAKSTSYVNNVKMYYIEDPTEVASDLNKRSDMLMEAITKVNSMAASDMLSACRYLNLLSESDYISIPILRAKLSEFAVSNAITFLIKMKDRDRNLITTIESAISLRILDISGEEYTYNQMVLGRNIPEILNTLQANMEKVRYIEADIAKVDTDMRRMKEEDMKTSIAKSQPKSTDIGITLNELEDNRSPEDIAMDQELKQKKDANTKTDDEFDDFNEGSSDDSSNPGSGFGFDDK